MSPPIMQYLTYQHNVQRFFLNHLDKYDGIIIPFSIALSFKGGTYGFIRALCSKDKAKAYALDPRTPLFQKDWRREAARVPHEKVANSLGEPFNTIGLNRRLYPSDFNDINIKSSVANCLNFQITFRHTEETNRKLKKYSNLLNIDLLHDLNEPMHLIPPYFEIDYKKSEDWYNINYQCLVHACHQYPSYKIRPVFHFSNWDNSIFANFLRDLTPLEITEFYLYPNFFKEQNASADSLKSYIQFVKDAYTSGYKPFSLFGGFFAILLSKFGLQAFANGIGYGEWRDSAYHKGGLAPKRIYIPKLHAFFEPATAQELIDNDPSFFKQHSNLLKKCVKHNQSLAQLDQGEILHDFMKARKFEISYVHNYDLKTIIDDLNVTYQRLFSSLPDYDAESYGYYLTNWANVLSTYT